MPETINKNASQINKSVHDSQSDLYQLNPTNLENVHRGSTVNTQIG